MPCDDKTGCTSTYNIYKIICLECICFHVAILSVISSGTLNHFDKGHIFVTSCSKRHTEITPIFIFDPLKSNFYTVELGFTGVNNIFLISA